MMLKRKIALLKPKQALLFLWHTCHMLPLSTTCGLMGPGGLAHIQAAKLVIVPGVWKG